MTLLSVENALALLLSDACPLEEERIALAHGLNRILSRDLTAQQTQPPFSASAMDGYAVRHCDLTKIPVRLNMVGQSLAGHRFSGKLKKNEAVRIFTGAPVPDGADTIVIQENTKAVGPVVEILQGSPPGHYIRKAGLDFVEGSRLLIAGTLLSPAALSLAASMNHGTFFVIRRPRVAVISTGDELVPPGGFLGSDQIIASNSCGVEAIVQQAGGTSFDLGIARDSKQSISALVGSAIKENFDIIVTLGGVSVGDHDLVRPTMEEAGFVFGVTQITMRPGKPFIFGKRGSTRFLGLPGNPVSSLITATIFLKPLVSLLAGYTSKNTQSTDGILQAELINSLNKNDARQEYMRAIATRDDHGKIKVKTIHNQDSSILSGLAMANCLLIRKPYAKAASPGDICSILPINNLTPMG